MAAASQRTTEIEKTSYAAHKTRTPIHNIKSQDKEDEQNNLTNEPAQTSKQGAHWTKSWNNHNVIFISKTLTLCDIRVIKGTNALTHEHRFNEYELRRDIT